MALNTPNSRLEIFPSVHRVTTNNRHSAEIIDDYLTAFYFISYGRREIIERSFEKCWNIWKFTV